MRFANDRKKSLTQIIDEYPAWELELWRCYDLVHGLDDPHLDACIVATVAGNVFGKNIDFEKLQGEPYHRAYAKPKGNVKAQFANMVANFKKLQSQD